jgi:hypothetical protein
VALQEPIDVGQDLLEALVAERPSSPGHGGVLQTSFRTGLLSLGGVDLAMWQVRDPRVGSPPAWWTQEKSIADSAGCARFGRLRSLRPTRAALDTKYRRRRLVSGTTVFGRSRSNLCGSGDIILCPAGAILPAKPRQAQGISALLMMRARHTSQKITVRESMATNE